MLSEEYFGENKILSLRKAFGAHGVVGLPNFFKSEVIQVLLSETYRLFEIRSKKNFIMPRYNTMRKLSVIGGNSLLGGSFVFPAIYLDWGLKKFLSSVVGETIRNISHQEEMVVVNILESESSTHGWHLDDPKFALVVILEAPCASNGGNVEIISRWREHCASYSLDPIEDLERGVGYARKAGKVITMQHLSGSAYLLNAADCLHRVTPITTEADRRIVVNFAYHNQEKIEYGETANFLYKKDMNVI